VKWARGWRWTQGHRVHGGGGGWSDRKAGLQGLFRVTFIRRMEIQGRAKNCRMKAQQEGEIEQGPQEAGWNSGPSTM
jgi:hypothetical protein